MSGALGTAFEKPNDILDNHDVFYRMSVLITASGLQGEQPLVDRIM